MAWSCPLHIQCFGEAFFLSSTSALHFLFAWTMCMDFNLVSSGTSSLRHGHHYSFELSMSPKTLWPPRQPVPSWDLHLHALPPLSLLLWLHLPPLHLHCQPKAFHPPTVLRQDGRPPISNGSNSTIRFMHIQHISVHLLKIHLQKLKLFKVSSSTANLTPQLCASTPSITRLSACTGDRLIIFSFFLDNIDFTTLLQLLWWDTRRPCLTARTIRKSCAPWICARSTNFLSSVRFRKTLWRINNIKHLIPLKINSEAFQGQV